MNNSNTWGDFNLNALFDIEYGNKFDLCALNETLPNADDAVAFVTRTATNNGVGTFVKRISTDPYPIGSITVALGGSIGSAFVQPLPFYTSQNVAVLLPKKGETDFLSFLQKLFVATLIKHESEIRFVAFGRELNAHIKKDFMIKLPIIAKNRIDWEWIEKYMKELKVTLPQTRNRDFHQGITALKWKSFRIADLFPKLQVGKAQDSFLREGNDCLYLGAKKDSNGVMRTCQYDSELAHEGNCIVFICNGQGSVGYTNYMDRPFIATTDLVMGYNKHLNPYVGMFLVTVLDLERPKYSFGRKWKTHLADTEIKLPATAEGEPDWAYMESYIKSLPYGDCI